jgi:hypothetical protein
LECHSDWHSVQVVGWLISINICMEEEVKFVDKTETKRRMEEEEEEFWNHKRAKRFLARFDQLDVAQRWE